MIRYPIETQSRLQKSNFLNGYSTSWTDTKKLPQKFVLEKRQIMNKSKTGRQDVI